MNIPPLPSVDCAILHEQFSPLDGERLFGSICDFARACGFEGEPGLMITSTAKDIHVLIGNYRVMVSQNDEPLSMDGFRTALTTPYTGMVFPEARDAVAGHRANTFITVAKGAMSLPQEFYQSAMGDLIGDMSAFTNGEEADRAFRLCGALTRLLAGMNPATAIHWCTSDNLVSQDMFESSIEGNDFTFIGLRPVISSSAGRMGEGLPIGLVANGSQWLVGKMIEIEEAPVPLPWMLHTLHGFVNLCRHRGSPIPHNESFSVDGEDWKVGVYHEKIDGFDGWEKIRLVVVHHPEFGIENDITAKRTFNYQSAEDVRARAEAEKTELTAANDVPANRRGYTNAASATKATEVAGLRQFAFASDDATASARSTVSQRKGLLKRLFGI